MSQHTNNIILYGVAYCKLLASTSENHSGAVQLIRLQVCDHNIVMRNFGIFLITVLSPPAMVLVGSKYYILTYQPRPE